MRLLLICVTFTVALAARKAEARDDIVAVFESDGVAQMVINDFPIDATITQGMISLQTDDIHCVASPAHPCQFTLNVLRVTLSPVVFSGKTINDSVAIINGPLVVSDQGEGLVVPAGTPVVTAFTIDGDRRTVNSTSPTGISVMLDVVKQEATVLGTFTGSLEDVNVEATLIANGQSPFLNLPPVANAGPDQTVTCGAPTHLDGSATSDLNNNLLLVSWSENGVRLGFGPTLDLQLGNGTHNILLEAFDTFEGRGTDTIAVQVVPDTTPPQFTSVPPRVTIHDCAAPDIGVAQAIDDCGVTSLTSDAPAVFPLGLTIVTWTAVDAAGNRATTTQEVFAELGDNPSCCPPGTNVIIGTEGPDVINGTAGSDCILGLGGDDVIFGNDGDDFLSGGPGNDKIFGGGHDGNGPHQPVFNDYLVGGDGDDKLFGGRGDDVLFGDAGNDMLHGNGGNDVLDGGADNDLCRADVPSTIVACEK